MTVLTMTARKYDSGGICIFCMGQFSDRDLTNEHIVPEAINGAAIIRGSCTRCARHSNKAYENQAIELDLKVPRMLLKLDGKGSAKPRSSRHLPIVQPGDQVMGGEAERLDFPVEDYPKFFHLPNFPPAGLVAGVDQGGNLTEVSVRFYNLGVAPGTDVTAIHKSEVAPGVPLPEQG